MFPLEHGMHRAEQLLFCTCMHGVQPEQVKGRHEVLSTRSESSVGSFSYEGASLQAS